MTNSEAIKVIKANYPSSRYSMLCEALDMAMSILERSRWIPFTTRPLDDEEREAHPEWDYILDCQLPDDGDVVLISDKWGNVSTDTFCCDDGCYFEGAEIECVVAWMPLPEPYEADGSKE